MICCQRGEIVPKWLLPTLSEVISLSDPTWVGNPLGWQNTSANIPSTSEQTDTSTGSGSSNGNGSLHRSSASFAARQVKVEREWTGAIAALHRLLQQSLIHSDASTIDLAGENAQCGFVLSGPCPVLSHPDLVKRLSSWTLASTPGDGLNWTTLQLLPAKTSPTSEHFNHSVLPLLPGDPLTSEQFCLVLTPWFSLVMVLGETLTGEPAFMFSFTPEVVQHAWEAIRPRVLLMSAHQVDYLDDVVQQFPCVVPDYRTVMQFSRFMLDALSEATEEVSLTSEVTHSRPTIAAPKANHAAQTTAYSSKNGRDGHSHEDGRVPHKVTSAGGLTESGSFDVELVKAIAHEVRTPLTTIRTLTRSLLKRSDLPPDVIRRLSIIDRECSEQIDRFGLIFKAVELESQTHQAPMSLIRTSLTDVFQQSIPRWQQQASQRQMTLDVVLPQWMPSVVSDPTVLDQALTSLIERFTRSLPGGSHIQVEVTLAGNQLKVQLQSQNDAATDEATKDSCSFRKAATKALGQVLMFQPETGSLSLNLAVTKNLFQAIGGKLIVKERPEQGEVMTVYLPLEVGSISPLDTNNIITV